MKEYDELDDEDVVENHIYIEKENCINAKGKDRDGNNSS